MRSIYTVILVLFFSANISGQVLYPNHYSIDYLKLLELEIEGFNTGITLHSSITSQYAPDSTLKNDVWKGRFKFFYFSNKKVQALYPSWNVSFNSKHPRGYNDGAQRQGEGFNSVLNFGISGKIEILHFTFAPIIYTAQITDLQIADSNFSKNESAKDIDWVQRFGDNAIYVFYLRQSEVRLVYKKATIGVSTQNMSWGPSQFNPILMSNNAAGFPHIDLGTNVSVSTSIGAGIGTGGNSDNIKFNHYSSSGMIGFDVTRIRFNGDYFFNICWDRLQS